MIVEVIDHQGLVLRVGEYQPLVIGIETEDLKKPGSPSYEKLKLLLERTPEPNELRAPGSAREGRVTW